MRGRHPSKGNGRQSLAAIDPTGPLTPDATAKFAQVAAMLAAEGMLYATSADALTRYAQLWVRNQRANAMIATDGPTVATATGIKRHPACGEADSTEKAMMAISRELGLTSVAAARIGAAPKNDETDALDEFDKPS